MKPSSKTLCISHQDSFKKNFPENYRFSKLKLKFEFFTTTESKNHNVPEELSKSHTKLAEPTYKTTHRRQNG